MKFLVDKSLNKKIPTRIQHCYLIETQSLEKWVQLVKTSTTTTNKNSNLILHFAFFHQMDQVIRNLKISKTDSFQEVFMGTELIEHGMWLKLRNGEYSLKIAERNDDSFAYYDEIIQVEVIKKKLKNVNVNSDQFF